MEILEAVHLSDKAEAYARTLSEACGGDYSWPRPWSIRRRSWCWMNQLPVSMWSFANALVLYPPFARQGNNHSIDHPLLEEAEELCDQIAIINKGEVVTCQPTEELLRSLDHKEFIVTVNEELTEVPEHYLGLR